MMRTIQGRYYVPNNSALVITGDVDAAKIFARVDALFADWKKGADPFVKFPLVKHPPLPKSEVVLVEQPVTTFSGEIEWQGPSTVGPSVDLTYAADLLGTALGEPSSRFQKALVDSGACVHADLSWNTQRNVGPITVSFEAAPDKADACVSAIFAELPRIKEASYFSDEDLKNAAYSLEIGLVHEREKPSAYAHAITFWWTSAGLDYYRSYIDRVKQVTRADLGRFLDGFVLGKPFVFGAMLSPEMAKKGLDRAHFEHLAGVPPGKEKPKPAGGAKTAKKGGK
jgi:zinc protease